jgi:uncharacterized membrane protein
VLSILSHTPTWVFAVFITLLVLGFLQSKPRTVKVRNVFLLPTAMVLFSFFGIFSVVGPSLVILGSWLAILIIATMIGYKLFQANAVHFSFQDNHLSLPGSWIPLLIMMAIFFTKYVVGVAVAKELPMVNELMFAIVLSVLYGSFSGIFLSRCLVMLTFISKKRNP